MASEKFCLRWNDFESNISVAFRELREEKDFFDVTLACDDSQVQAHKVILSACSPFFRNILRRNPHQHPLLYLKGVKYKELLSVLNFMYQGEVNVAQEELNSFLAVAEDLRVKGLTQNNSGTSSSSSTEKQRAPSPKISRPPAPPERDPVPPPKRPRPAPPPQSYHQDDDDIQEVQPIVKSEPVSAPAEVVPQQQQYATAGQQSQQQVALEDDAYADESYDYGEYGDGGYDDGSGMIDPNTGLPIQGAGGADGNKGTLWSGPSIESEAMKKMIPMTDDLGLKMWQCSECDYRVKNSNDLRKHVERKHLECRVSCDICFQVFNCRYRLQQHHRSAHQNAF